MTYKIKKKEVDSKKSVELIEAFIDFLKKEHKLELLELIEEERIPISIFVRELGPLEAVIKYLKENKKLKYKDIAKIVKREEGVIGVSYRNSLKKFRKILPIDSKYFIPFSIFSKKFSVLESVVVYLKENYSLSFQEIANLLNRSNKTIWTVYQRARKKNVK